MPAKYIVRNLRGNSYYHTYNRGGNEAIFLDDDDYKTFLYYLYIYTAPMSEVAARHPELPARLKAKNLGADVRLVAYCLMPDHFHLLLKQQSSDIIPKLLKQMSNAYTTYFNTKYKRKGKLMHGRYKATLIESEYLLVQMVRFVHLNPPNFGDHLWSSYKHPLQTNELLNRFDSPEEWEKFHLDQNSYQLNLPKIKHLIIE